MNLSFDYEKRMREMLGPEAEDYFASLEAPHTRGLCINPFKTDGTELPAVLEGLKEFAPGCFEFRSAFENRPSVHPYYAAGLYYIQEPSAMLPVLLAPLNGDELALDMCAAPGGKSSQLAGRLKEGRLIANEKDYVRSGILLENMVRCGYANTAVTNAETSFFAECFPETFDAVLADSPCSGEGMLRKEPGALKQWSEKLVKSCASVQKEIVTDAARCLRNGGLLIYSTCTFSEEEDEEVADYIISLGFEEIRPDSVPSFLKECRHGYKCFPHRFGEGQYFCYFKKTSGSFRKPVKAKYDYASKNELKEINEVFSPNGDVVRFRGGYCIPALGFDIPTRGLLSQGIYLGKMESRRFVPHHAGAVSTLDINRNVYSLPSDDERIQKYLKGEEIPLDGKGWGVLAADGKALGLVKCSGGYAKNHYPKHLRMKG